MKSLGLSDFSDLLLDIYGFAREQTIDAFQDAALDRLRSVVPFDTSIWGTATLTDVGVDIHSIHLHRTSAEMLQAYELVKHEDTSASSMMAGNVSTGGFHSPGVFARTEVGEFLRRFGHQNFFVSQKMGGETRFVVRTVVVSHSVGHGLLFLRARARCRADALTAREFQIARRVAQGQTHKEIAQELMRSPATVRNQIQAIYAKLQVGNIAGLVEAIRAAA